MPNPKDGGPDWLDYRNDMAIRRAHARWLEPVETDRDEKHKEDPEGFDVQEDE